MSPPRNGSAAAPGGGDGAKTSHDVSAQRVADQGETRYAHAAAAQPRLEGDEPRHLAEQLVQAFEQGRRPRPGASATGLRGAGDDPGRDPQRQAAELAAALVSAAAPALDCPACGWPGGIVDQRADGLGLACRNCFLEGDPDDFLAVADRRNVEAWARIPDEARGLLSAPEAERPLRALAMELLGRGARPDLVELAVVGVNLLRCREGKACALEVEARRICREAAGTLARRVGSR